MVSKYALTGFLLTVLIGLGSAQDKKPGQALPDNGLVVKDSTWTRVEGPQGARISIPAGFKAFFGTKGKIRVLGEEGKMSLTTPYVLIHPCIVNQDERADHYLKRNVISKYRELPDFKVERFKNDDPARATYRLRYALKEVPRLALIHCSLNGRVGMCYSLSAPYKTFEDIRPYLARTALSLRYKGPKRKTASDPIKSISFKTWADPKEGAFTVRVPAGWSVRGGLVRRDPLDITPAVKIVSPDGKTTVRLGHPDCALFIEPDPLLEAAGMYEGRWFFPGAGRRLKVMTYRRGASFFFDYLVGQNKSRRALDTISHGTLLGLQKKLAQPMENLYGKQVSRQIDVSHVTYRMQKGEDTTAGYVICTTQRWTTKEGSRGWSVPAFCSWEAPVSGIQRAEALAKNLAKSFEVRPSWAATQPGMGKAGAQAWTHIYRDVAESMERTSPARIGRLKSIFQNGADTGNKVLFLPARGHNYYWVIYPQTKDDEGPQGDPADIDLTPLLAF